MIRYLKDSDGNTVTYVPIRTAAEITEAGLSTIQSWTRAEASTRTRVRHSQDKGSTVHKAFIDIPDENREYAMELMESAKARRDYNREIKATKLYEKFRELDRKQLADLAGYDAPRQQLIAALIEREL